MKKIQYISYTNFKFILPNRGLLRFQTNMDEHDPEICDDVNLWKNHSTNCYKIRPQLTAPEAMVVVLFNL